MVIIISSMEEGSREGEQGREEGEQEEREGSLVCLGMVTQVVRDSSMSASSLILPGRLSVCDWQMGLTGRPYIATSQQTADWKHVGQRQHNWHVEQSKLALMVAHTH